MNYITTFAKALDQKANELYTKDEWAKRRARYDLVGLDTGYYDMQCETYGAVYDENPDLFEGCEWINSEDGMPLWVRPGTRWIPDYKLDD